MIRCFRHRAGYSEVGYRACMGCMRSWVQVPLARPITTSIIAMENTVSKLQLAFEFAMKHRPLVGGFPFLAECLRLAGVRENVWLLPACQSIYKMETGGVVSQMTPLETSMVEIPPFNKEALITALRADQNGTTTFPQFLEAVWKAGVTSYSVHFNERYVTYHALDGQSYTESYPQVVVDLNMK